ncbi:MAG TPA: gamma subclass chorismate mutase AroQ [Pirellulales bacterium]|nr:gamma subclass chorismate mutase AroQ [Pirellulales bacterium]
MVVARLMIALSLLLAAVIGCAPAASEPKPPQAGKSNVAAAPAPAAAADALLELMRERLLVMHDVARWKWNAKRPIADPQREQALLAELGRRGADYGLAPAEVRSFMRAQIEAGKLVQEADWRQWEAEGRETFADAPDLQAELRPKIDRLSEQLLATYAKLLPQLAEPSAREQFKDRAAKILSGDGIDERVREQALDWRRRGNEILTLTACRCFFDNYMRLRKYNDFGKPLGICRLSVL